VSRIRLAVVGAGRAGQARIRAIKEHRDGLLVAVVHRGVPPRFPEMLMETSIDAVIICTPNALHVPMAVAALEAGKHVLVEFPLAPGPDAARELEGGGTELSVDLAFARGGSTRLVETRAPGRARATHWAIECERGVLDDPPPEPSQGLFLDDLDWFLRRIQGQGGSYLPDVRILHVLGLVASIEAQL
jgi:hypothetical protein